MPRRMKYVLTMAATLMAATGMVTGQEATTAPVKEEAVNNVAAAPRAYGDYIEPDTTVQILPEQLQVQEEKEGDVVVRRFTYYVDQHGQELKHGTYEEFYHDGTPQRTVTYEHGKPHGVETWYYSDGSRWKVLNSKRGVLDGTCKEYSRTGAIREQRQYKDGTLIRTRKR